MTGRVTLVALDDHEGRVRAAPAMRRLHRLAEVTILDRPLDAGRIRLDADVQVLLAIRERTRIDADLLDRLPQLELILQTGGHAYHLDAEAATARGILVALGRHVQGPTRAVPELVFGLLLSLLRAIPETSAEMRSGGWPNPVGRVLHGRTLGVLGLGRLGLPVARLGLAFGMRVVAWGPTLTAERARAAGIERLDLDELLKISDAVTIHLRLSDRSRDLLDRRRIKLLHPGAVLVNTARGAMVDEAALVDSLTAGRLAGAALDVYADEPLAADHPLRSLPNVVLTPHIGWKVEEVFDEFVEVAAGQLEAYLGHRLPREQTLNPAALAVARPRHGGIADA